MENKINQTTSSRSSLLKIGPSYTKIPFRKDQINTPENRHASHDDSTNMSIHDISQSMMGKTLRRFNQ